MNSLVVVNIFIILLHILILVNLTTAIGGLGESSCRYSANFDSKNEKCHKDIVKLDKLPRECTSFVFDGVVCNKDYEIVFNWVKEDLEHLKLLVDFEGGTHNVYLFYKHRFLEEWSFALFHGDFQTEAQKVKDFVGQYAVKGLILDGIDDPVDDVYSKNSDGDFHKNFTAYVTAIKTMNPRLEIGLYLTAVNFIEFVNLKSTSTWFDFLKLNDLLDFFIFDFSTLNECRDDLLHGGVTPLDSTDPAAMTLNKFADALKQSTIAKEKVYFEFLISPIPTPAEEMNFMHCELSYNEYCENRETYQRIWCADTQDTLFKKGAFAKQYSKGFIGRDIDLVDRDNKCKCDNKYITFFMLLHGYTNSNNPVTCEAFN